MTSAPHVYQLHDPSEKAKAASLVLADLPEWFGIPANTNQYVEDARELPFWLATAEKETVAFITLQSTSEDSAQIHCMGVKKAYQRQGVGSRLYQALEDYARSRYKYLQVKTVAEGCYLEYDQTVAFYRKMGFAKLEVFPSLWDEWNPCLIMVKYLG